MAFLIRTFNGYAVRGYVGYGSRLSGFSGRTPWLQAGMSLRYAKKCLLDHLQLRGVGGIAVDLNRIKSFAVFVIDQCIWPSAGIPHRDRPIETGPIANVTASARARHVHTQPNCVLVIVNSQLYDGLGESAGGALVPQALSTAAPIVCLPRFDSPLKRLGVHVSDHQNVTCIRVSSYTGDESINIEFGCKILPLFYLLNG